MEELQKFNILPSSSLPLFEELDVNARQAPEIRRAKVVHRNKSGNKLKS